jgi:hypothetical protein
MITAPLFQMQNIDSVTPALDKPSAAFWTIGVLAGMAWHVANVNKVESFLQRPISGSLQGRDWGWRQTLQFVERIKSAEV